MQTLLLNQLDGQAIPLGATVIAVMKAPVSIASSASAAKQSQLSIPVKTGETYLFEADLPFALAGTTSGYKFSTEGPAMSFVHVRKSVIDGTNKAIVNYAQGDQFQGIAAALAVIGDHEASLRGMFTPSADGEFSVRFAQNTSHSSAITLKQGACLKLTRIG